MPEIYTPGYSVNATRFMAKRTVESHAANFCAHLRPGMQLQGWVSGGSVESSVRGGDRLLQADSQSLQSMSQALRQWSHHPD